MCAQKEEIVPLTITNSDGEVVVECVKDVADMLMSDKIDPEMKETICKQLLQQKDAVNSKVSKWDSDCEKLLLEKYSSFEEGKTITRHRWKAVAEEMNKSGYNFTPEQCRLKIKSLKEKFDRNKKKMAKSGESPPESDCDDLYETFSKCPDMKPKYVIDTCSSSHSLSGELEECTPTVISEPTAPKRNHSSASSATCSKDEQISEGPQEERKKTKRSVEVMKDFLGDVMTKREEAAERRHKEKMESVNSLINILKEAVKKDI